MPNGYRKDGTPNGSGYPHGGNGRSAEEVKRMQEAYAEALVQGKTQTEAKALTGYHPNHSAKRVEGGAIDQTIKRTLDKHGITDDFLAEEYLDGLQRSKMSGAKDAAFSAHAQYLKQLGYLLGHTKHAPQVAVQINNQNGPSNELDSERIKAIVGLLEEEIANRESSGVHDEGAGATDTKAHPGVVESVADEKAVGDRGQS